MGGRLGANDGLWRVGVLSQIPRVGHLPDLMFQRDSRQPMSGQFSQELMHNSAAFIFSGRLEVVQEGSA